MSAQDARAHALQWPPRASLPVWVRRPALGSTGAGGSGPPPLPLSRPFLPRSPLRPVPVRAPGRSFRTREPGAPAAATVTVLRGSGLAVGRSGSGVCRVRGQAWAEGRGGGGAG